MRHKKNFNHLGRQAGHRKAMLANMASSLILHKRISTTTAKAKALKIFVEPLITKSKDDTTHTRRIVFSYLQSKEAVSELFREISPKIASRPGGYTRILKTGVRLGDSADMCVIELVDYNENLLAAKDDSAKSSRRRRRGGSKKATADQVTAKTGKPGSKEVDSVSDEAIIDTEASEINDKVVAKEENIANTEAKAADPESIDENKMDKAEDSEETKAE